MEETKSMASINHFLWLHATVINLFEWSCHHLKLSIGFSFFVLSKDIHDICHLFLVKKYCQQLKCICVQAFFFVIVPLIWFNWPKEKHFHFHLRSRINRYLMFILAYFHLISICHQIEKEKSWMELSIEAIKYLWQHAQALV